MTDSGGIAALIMAAGRGERAAMAMIPKQYHLIGGQPVIRRSVAAMLAHEAVTSVRVVIAAGDEGRYRDAIAADPRLGPPIVGGDTRQASVARGLEALAANPPAPAKVLIHDAARPFVPRAVIDRVVAGLAADEAVVPTLPAASTLKRVDRGHVVGTVLREGVHAAETPQGFRFATILAAHRRAAAEGRFATDDAALVEWMGVPVAAVAGDPGNVKLTTADDLAAAERRLTMEAALRLLDVRVGLGHDVHAFGPGDHVTLGGVAIPHGQGLKGHSDADVVLHALTDAILGALADGDIGLHFPPSDARFAGASSDRFLADAAARVRARGGVIGHLDVTILAEAPRIGPHRDAMRARIAAIAGVPVDRVAVKAGTSEGLGFVGRREGIVAYATATVRLPLAIP
jgi:2-C-methyl-D-erythritol 4-phosphate cytidylyltransferase/2-C-methyl-D-erythritol 2,4-cyclodiphosphate synthase